MTIACLLLLGAATLLAPVLAADPVDIPYDATTAYGEVVIPDGDISESMDKDEIANRYKKARMAFLFGQYELAFKTWEPLANMGNAKAQATLAWMYHTGKGVPKNLHKAFYWYQRAAYQSHEIAHNNLGVFYEQGLGVRRNYAKAAQHYREAAELGYGFAQYNLGMLYQRGKGIKKSKKQAIYWLQIASWQGVKQAQAQLQNMGLKVDIPQHKQVNEASKKAANTPKWHRKSDTLPHGTEGKKGSLKSGSKSTRQSQTQDSKDKKSATSSAKESKIPTSKP